MPSNQVTPEAFYRRPRPKDSNGLSVSTASAADAVTPEGNLLDWFGVATLHVGKVRAVRSGMDVVPDSATHGNIQGIPYREDDEATAQFIADRLSADARLCCIALRMRPKPTLSA